MNGQDSLFLWPFGKQLSPFTRGYRPDDLPVWLRSCEDQSQHVIAILGVPELEAQWSAIRSPTRYYHYQICMEHSCSTTQKNRHLWTDCQDFTFLSIFGGCGHILYASICTKYCIRLGTKVESLITAAIAGFRVPWLGVYSRGGASLHLALAFGSRLFLKSPDGGFLKQGYPQSSSISRWGFSIRYSPSI